MRRIAVFSGTRADFGHLQWVLHELAARDDVVLQLILGGSHFEERFGHTATAVEATGLDVAARIRVPLADDSALAVARFMGESLAETARVLSHLVPDLLVVLGDRYEVLTAASAALPLRLPVAHLHGGERSEGAFDESIRHAVTKLSHLHFAAAEPYAARIRQLGENPEHVYTPGAPGLDHLLRTQLADRSSLERDLALTLPADAPLLLVTYHPATLSAHDPTQAISQLQQALTRWMAREPRTRIVCTGVNADPHHGAISAAWHDFARTHETVRVVPSLGQARYLGLMRMATAVVGNSSSGLIEAPALRVSTVNIGDRQRGRLMASSVLCCSEEADAILQAIARAADPGFRASWPAALSLYGDGQASARIAHTLATVPLETLLLKRFCDVAVP
jgi:UDP-N-acetylglucosamine 2-epimerase (non-hydrolysing)